MGKFRGVLLLLAFGITVSTGQARADETITNCAEVTAASPDDTDSTPANADFTKDPALFEDDESCVKVTKVVPYDYGDAPDPTYPTTEPNSGAKHLLGSNVYLGSCVDADSGTQQGDATADDQNAGAYTFGTCNGTDDEDGVTFPAIHIGATGLSLDIVANAACNLNAWIDWNGDGDWDDADEKIASDLVLVAGNNNLPITVSTAAKAGDTYSRFRCSTATGAGISDTTGEAPDGEVEDYKITIKAVPGIKLKKYVQQAVDDNGAAAPAFDIATPATWGMDAQDDDSAKSITYGKDALYTLIVENTGHTYLSNIQLDEEIQNCVPNNPLTQVYDSNAATHAAIMAPAEIWAFQCSLANIQSTVTNIAKVKGTPIEPPVDPSDPTEPTVPTGQTPPSDLDPAVVTTSNNPAISLKKYVMPAPDATATAIVEGDANTYGEDAQDNASAQNIVFGESATYRIRVENTGSTWLDNVVVDDVIEACDPLTKVAGAVGDSDATTPDGVMSIGEVWWLECTLPAVQTDVTNIATVSARPIHTPTNPADPTTYEPTGQSPVNDTDPANVTTNATSAITLKKYVQAADNAPAIANPFAAAWDATWGEDAQGSASAVNITYATAALYRIKVQNTGGTWLGNVLVDDHVDACGALTKVEDSDATTPDGVMSPNEIWWLTCTLDSVNDSQTNIATVTADPVETPADPNDPLVKLKGFPVTADDPASVDTTADPRIKLKKYVQPALNAPAWNGTLASLGDDAQDSQHATGIDYGADALYSITVQNTGATWLDTVNVDDVIDACDPLTLIASTDVDADNMLAPNEMWVFQCTLAAITDETLENTATVSARPVNPDGTPTNQSPVTDTDPAHIKTGSHSIGNMIWIDDGKGNATYANDGQRNNGEMPVPNGAVVELWNADHSTQWATTVTTNGFYLFDHLAAGSYQVCVAATNFATNQVLAAYGPSTGGNQLNPEDNVDSDDNGEDDLTEGLCSGALVLGSDEPTDESPANGGSAGNDGVGTEDLKSNLTVDFAVVPTYSLGNQIWIDDGAGTLANANNGQLDAGESPVPDTVQLELLDSTGAVVDTVTPTSGYYLFNNLTPADYKVRIAASNFASGGVLEGFQSCTHVNESDANNNVDGNDNGLDVDPTIAGITTSTVTLGDGEPTLEIPTASGVAGNDGSNRPDINTNLTVDLCVVKLAGIGNRVWIDESDPDNRDGSQINNGIYDANEEPAANVEVQVYPVGADPKTTSPYATTVTDAEGCYHVNNLPEGQYFVHLPATNFANGNLLEGLISSTGAGADDGLDENADENGADGSTPKTDGISSIAYDLMAGAEVDAETSCGNNPTTLANNSIDDTADFGLVRAKPAKTAAISIKKYVQPAAGAPTYDPTSAATHAATIGQDAQTNDAAVSILYRETALYTVVVKNTGSVYLTDVNPDDEIADCNLQRVYPTDTRVVLSPDESWVYQCTLDEIKQDITNIAKVNGLPIEPPVDPTLDPNDPKLVLIPTGQTKPSDVDPAVITTEFGPGISIKKYVLDKSSAPALVEGDVNTYGADAQDDRSALNITYGKDALYRIRVMNTGTTWLDNVVVDDRIEGCVLDQDNRLIDTNSVTPNGVMAVGEVWWLECTLDKIIEPVSNIADVKGTPAHVPEDPANPPAALEPTGQSPVYDTDPANVTTYIGPSIKIKKFVQPALNAKAFDANDNTTWGEDAQDTASAVNITYTQDALYRIKVQNTGETWLDQVEVDDQIAGCALETIAGTTDSTDKFMSPNEIWWYECTLANITDDVMNLATVDAVPTHEDKTTTEHSPINDTDPAFIHTTADPGIEIKKYVQDAEGALQWNLLDPNNTLGADAQDAQHAVLVAYDGTAKYRIQVTNTGATWLDNVVVDDVIDDCDLQRIYQSNVGDTDEVLSPNEYWVYECDLSNVKDELLANIATVSARPINEDGTSRDQSPVDGSDPAHIRTGSHRIGNLVWLDDGQGNSTYASNGKRDNGETVVPDGVKIELWNGDATAFITETLTTDGYYLFHHLPAGDYKVCVSSANFTPGALLQAYGPSVGGQFEEADPDSNGDNNDNGDDTIAFGICSDTLTLAADEPTNETPTDNGASGQDGQGTDDNKSNLTVDFGVVPTYSLGNQIWIDDGAGNLANANNGKLDAGEQPVADTVVLELLDVNGAVKASTSPSNGFYLFDTLMPDDYKVRIAASNFAVGGVLEGFQSCTHGNEIMPNDNGDGNDNGLDTDPRIAGISTGIISLGDNEPTLEKPTANGIAGSDGSNRPDAYTNLTVDLCVVKLTGIGNRVWIDESNPDLRDTNEVNNAAFDDGELTVANAEVQLFPENADPDFDDYYAVTTTDRNGCYHFNDLPEGKYFVHIPAYQAVVAGDQVAALSAYVSSSGEGADNGIDDTSDENGKDDFNANSAGISSILFDLKANDERTGERVCGNNNTFLADNSIDDTADFGLVSDLSVGDRIWIDGNGNGIQDDEEHPLPGATVELLQNGNVIAQATSNANGNYLFDHLTPGDYSVKVTPPSGYYPTLIYSADPNIDNNTDSDCKAVAGDTAVETGIVTLELGNEPVNDGDVMNPSSNLTIDCGFYRPVAVGNLIWEDLKNVDGIDNDNATLEDITVELVKDDMTPVVDVFGNTVDPVVTLADGKYSFENLTPGAYIVKVNPPTLGYELTINSGDKPDENPSNVDSNCLAADNNTFVTPAFNLFNYAEPESTVDGDDTDRDMTVDCGFYRPVSIGDYAWIDENGNGIQDGNEAPLENVIVSLLDVNGDPVEDIFGNEVEPIKTTEDGAYLFNNLSSDDYIVQFTPPEGFHPTAEVTEEPNDDINIDSNCIAIEGDITGTGLTQAVKLLWGTEPTDDGDADPATNRTVDCGFEPNVFNIPTLSEWAYLLLMMLMVGIAWRMKGIKR